METSHPILPGRFETERLVLRGYDGQDAGWYYAMSLRNREHLRQYESGNVVMSLTSEADARETLEALSDYWKKGTCYFIGTFKKPNDQFVAQVYVGLFSREPVDYIIGYIADCDHEGQGYVTEAVSATVGHIFDALGADQVRIHCDEGNVRSRQVAERCGFALDRLFPEEKVGPDGVLEPCTTASYLRVRMNRRPA